MYDIGGMATLVEHHAATPIARSTVVRSPRQYADDDSQHTAGPQNTSERMQKAMDAFALPDATQVID
jgi:hypothetical protein